MTPVLIPSFTGNWNNIDIFLCNCRAIGSVSYIRIYLCYLCPPCPLPLVTGLGRSKEGDLWASLGSPSRLVNCPSGDSNHGAAHHGLATSSGGRRGFADIGALSPGDWSENWARGFAGSSPPPYKCVKTATSGPWCNAVWRCERTLICLGTEYVILAQHYITYTTDTGNHAGNWLLGIGSR